MEREKEWERERKQLKQEASKADATKEVCHKIVDFLNSYNFHWSSTYIFY